MKEYKRYCDVCGEEINPYAIGAITLYRNIRFGVGKRYVDFLHEEGMAIKPPDDYDFFGKGFKSDDDREFSFCDLDHCLQFITEAYEEIVNKVKRR